jgi:putative colanic acid biosynthesis glycosyltransferase
LKVLQINSTVNKGSTGRIAEQIGELLIEQSEESIIAFGRNSNFSKSQTYRIGSEIDVKLHGAYSLLLGKHGEASISATKRFLDFLDFENPDIIHIHNLHGYYLNFPLLFNYIKRNKKKVVWTLHDCWAFTGHCTYFSDIECEKWQSKCINCPKKGNYPKSLFFDTSEYYFKLKKKTFNYPDIYFVTVSNWLKETAKASFLNRQPIICINNGVDENQFINKQKNQDLINKYKLADKTVLLAASTSWAKQKGYDDYLKLSKKLLPNEIIILIGLPDKLRKALPDNIIGIERTENTGQLADWYSTSDIVLNLSYQESFGLTSVEGFMCGKPTIVYNCTASPELIVNSELGKIVYPGDIDGVYFSIQELKRNIYSSQKIRDIAINNFSAHTQYQKYISLYKSILKSV